MHFWRGGEGDGVDEDKSPPECDLSILATQKDSRWVDFNILGEYTTVFVAYLSFSPVE